MSGAFLGADVTWKFSDRAKFGLPGFAPVSGSARSGAALALNALLVLLSFDVPVPRRGRLDLHTTDGTEEAWRGGDKRFTLGFVGMANLAHTRKVWVPVRTGRTGPCIEEKLRLLMKDPLDVGIEL